MIQGNYYPEGWTRARIVCGSDYTITEDRIISLEVQENLIEGNNVSVGSASSRTATAELFNISVDGQTAADVDGIEVDDYVQIFIDNGQEGAATYTAFPLGFFYVTGVTKRGIRTTVELVDALEHDYNDQWSDDTLAWESGIDIINVVNRIANVQGGAGTGFLYQVYEPIKDYKRNILANYAGMRFGNLRTSRVDGSLWVKPLPSAYSSVMNLSGDNCFALEIERKQSVVKAMLYNSVTKYSTTKDSDKYNLQIAFDNGLLSLGKDPNRENKVAEIWSWYEDLQWRGFTAECVGDPRLEAGDCVDIYPVGSQTAIPTVVFGVTYTYDGALKMRVHANTDTIDYVPTIKDLDNTQDEETARLIKEEGTKTNAALKGLEGGMLLNGFELWTDLSVYAVYYDSAAQEYKFVNGVPSSYNGYVIQSDGGELTKVSAVFDDITTQNVTRVQIAGKGLYYTTIDGSTELYVTTKVTTGNEVFIPTYTVTRSFAGIFAKKIDQVSDMAQWDVGEIGYILTAVNT